MTRKDEIGFVWRPLDNPWDWPWLRAICVVAVSLAIGFVAGRSSLWTRQSTIPHPTAVAETNAPSAVPVPATTPSITQAETSRRQVPNYVVINPGTVSDDSEKQSAVDPERATKGLPHHKPSVVVRSPSTAKLEPAKPRRNDPAPDYLSLREYVLGR